MNKTELLELIKNNESVYDGKYHKIKHLFLREKSSDHLLVVFSGFNGGEVVKKPPVYNYINTLEDIKINKLFIMDNVNNTPVYYYGTKGRDSYLEDTSNLIENYANKLDIVKSRIITTGSSKGGTGSLIVGLRVRAGHIIAAANQLYVGSYLNTLPKVRELMFNKIFGSNDDIYVSKLDDIFKSEILVGNTDSNLYFHAGSRDSHYKKHMVPMLKHFDQKKIYYELDLRNYVGHNSVIYYYPDYLRRKLKEITDLPSLTQPSLMRDKDNVNIQVNVSYDRKATHFYQVELILEDEVTLVSSYKKDLLHTFEIDANEIKSVKITLKEYEIIRDSKEFNFYDLKSNLYTLHRKDLIVNEWISGDGRLLTNKNMVRTKNLPYVNGNEYVITGSATVAYYKNNKFLVSKKVAGKVSELPFYLETVEEADSIILSFNKKWLGKIQYKTLNKNNRL